MDPFPDFYFLPPEKKEKGGFDRSEGEAASCRQAHARASKKKKGSRTLVGCSLGAFFLVCLSHTNPPLIFFEYVGNEDSSNQTAKFRKREQQTALKIESALTGCGRGYLAGLRRGSPFPCRNGAGLGTWKENLQVTELLGIPRGRQAGWRRDEEVDGGRSEEQVSHSRDIRRPSWGNAASVPSCTGWYLPVAS